MHPVHRLAALGATLLVALGLTPVPAQAGFPVTVSCSQSPTELRWDDTTYEVEGTCSVVKVLADDVVVHMPTATRLVVRGHRNSVDAKSIGSLAVQGSDHVVRTPSVRRLKVASPGSRVAVEGLAETVRLTGRRATVTADRLSTLVAPGDDHTVRARLGVDATLGGNANTVRYRRLDALAVKGDHNSARVRRGATEVRNEGRANQVRVARRG